MGISNGDILDRSNQKICSIFVVCKMCSVSVLALQVPIDDHQSDVVFDFVCSFVARETGVSKYCMLVLVAHTMDVPP